MNKLFFSSLESLNTEIRTCLLSPILPEKNNAGLGLLFIAKKHFENVTFLFEDRSPNYSYFTLSVNITAHK